MLARMWRKGTLVHSWWEFKLKQPLWKTVEVSPSNYHMTQQFYSQYSYADDTTLMGESKEELKSILMKLKEESEKVGLNTTFKK